MLFDNRRDAMSRLEGTIVFYKNRAMYVTGIDDRIRLHGHMILTREDAVVDQDDEELSMSCPPLGYINVEGDAYYFMRQPMRRWKQGVDVRALVCPTMGIRARGAVNDRLIAQCLENDYPSFEGALAGFSTRNPFKAAQGEGRRGIAFSKHFAVRKKDEGIVLAYKGKNVGVVEKDQPILSTKHQWLTEALEAEL